MSLFITFEGIDGSGKTLQIKCLKEYLESLGYELVVVREPGGTKIGEKIRNILLDNNNTNINYEAEALLYAASRAQLISEVIKPALDDKKIVISDRFIDSTLMYQGILRGLGVEKIQEINNFAVQNIKPDITFLLDVTVEVSSKRKKNRANLDRLDNEKEDFYRKLRQEYLSLASNNRDRIVVINSMRSPNVVSEGISKVLKSKNLI